MECKRCGRELPPDQEKHCPFCGQHLGTYIIPRNQRQQTVAPRKKKRRSSILTYVSVGVLLLIVAVLVPFLREYNKEQMLTDIQQRYENIKKNKGHYNDKYPVEEEDRQMQYLGNSIDKFKRSYPKEETEHKRIEGLRDELAANRIAESSDDEYLIKNAETMVIANFKCVVTPANNKNDVNLSIQWTNPTNQTVTQAQLGFRAYNQNGEKVMVPDPKNPGKTKALEKIAVCENVKAGARSDTTYLALFHNKEVVSVRPFIMEFTYPNRKAPVVLSQKVCEDLWWGTE